MYGMEMVIQYSGLIMPDLYEKFKFLEDGGFGYGKYSSKNVPVRIIKIVFFSLEIDFFWEKNWSSGRWTDIIAVNFLSIRCILSLLLTS